MAKIDLNRASLFVKVVDAGSFTAAAAGLGAPVSSVSRGVAALEDQLGVRLLHRTTRKLSLTDAGRHYHRRMQTVIAETEAATEEVAGFAAEPKGTVRITAAHDMAMPSLPPIIDKVIQRYPRIVIDLMLTSRRVDLANEGIDLAIRGGRLDDSSLVARRIMLSDLGVFAAPSYLSAHGRPRVLADLAHHRCLCYGNRAAWRLEGPRGEETVDVTGPVVCADMLFLREMAVRGAGLAQLPMGQTTAQDVAAGRLVRVLPRHAFRGGGLYLVWPARTLVPARVVAVRELLTEELTRLALASSGRRP
jgi:DNA-binding transcriptional LysR family regulator